MRPNASGLPMPDLERGQMPGNVVGIKGGTGKGANRAGTGSGLGRRPHGGVIEVRPEYCHGGLERVRPHRRLPPAYHLGVEPGRLNRIRTRGALAPYQEVTVALADAAIGRDLEAA